MGFVENLDKGIEKGLKGLNKGIPGGLPRFDKKIFNIQPGKQVSIVGAPKSGKTYFMLWRYVFRPWIAGERNIKWILYSLEVDAQQVSHMDMLDNNAYVVSECEYKLVTDIKVRSRLHGIGRANIWVVIHLLSVSGPHFTRIQLGKPSLVCAIADQGPTCHGVYDVQHLVEALGRVASVNQTVRNREGLQILELRRRIQRVGHVCDSSNARTLFNGVVDEVRVVADL